MGFFYRIGQYLSAVRAELFGAGGEEYIAKYLSESEQRLWRTQKAPDRAHSLNVARTADELQNNLPEGLTAEERIILLKAALLHDIGRGEFGSSLAKSLAVLLTKFGYGGDNKKTDAKRRPETPEEFSGSGYRASLMYHYYCHAEIGAKLLSDMYHQNGELSEAEKRIIHLVKHHRDEEAGDDRLLKLLIEADRMN